jgi:1,2-phenylacetyl-CoA epoxidase PaaB subunit
MTAKGTGDRVYEVFARAEFTQPLAHVGSLRAPADDLARAYARATFDEDHWVEMIAVPRTHIVSVIPLVVAS